MNQTDEKKKNKIRRHWKLIALVVSVGIFIAYSFQSVESTKSQMTNEPEKVYQPIFVTEEEIQILKEKSIVNQPEKIPYVDYEKIYHEVKQGMILFKKLNKNDREVSDYCKLHYSYDNDGALVAKPNCFSLATEQEKTGIKNSFYHLLNNKPGYFESEKPIEKIIEDIITEEIKNVDCLGIDCNEFIFSENQSGKTLTFLLKEKMGVSHP